MPRMLRRAAVLGATAHVASNRGAARAQAQAQGAQNSEPEPDPAAQQPAGVPQQPAPVAEAAAPEDRYGDLMKLKELLDAGALTQAEFDTQKQKILGS
jgi:hypothetical protein